MKFLGDGNKLMDMEEYSGGIQTSKSLGVECHEALIKAGGLKGDAFRAERLFKSIRKQFFLHHEGSVAEREAKASGEGKVEEREADWIKAETAYNLAKAEADGLQIRFEEWRTEQSTRRAEMKIL